MDFKDYYKVLGVSANAPQDEIKKQYRKLARKYHPDVSQDKDAEERFKEVNEAYEALKDPEKRKTYDQYKSNYEAGYGFQPPPGWQGGGGRSRVNPEDLGGFSDFFSSIFGGGFDTSGFGGAQGGFNQHRPSKGQDIQSHVKLDLATIASGGKTRVSFNGPNGKARTLDIQIPKGIAAGKKIRISGQGQPGRQGGPSGDLYLEIQYQSDPRFTVDGKNLITPIYIEPWQAVLGDKTTLETLAGKVELKVPPKSSSGKKMRLKGKGLDGGDLIAEIHIKIPDEIPLEQIELYEALKKASSS